MADDNYPEEKLTAHCCARMTKYIDQLADKFGISQEDAANEWLLALIACGYELGRANPLQASPLKTVVSRCAPQEEIEAACHRH